jgi:hypothetical protein
LAVAIGEKDRMTNVQLNLQEITETFAITYNSIDVRTVASDANFALNAAAQEPSRWLVSPRHRHLFLTSHAGSGV